MIKERQKFQASEVISSYYKSHISRFVRILLILHLLAIKLSRLIIAKYSDMLFLMLESNNYYLIIIIIIIIINNNNN